MYSSDAFCILFPVAIGSIQMDLLAFAQPFFKAFVCIGYVPEGFIESMGLTSFRFSDKNDIIAIMFDGIPFQLPHKLKTRFLNASDVYRQ